MSAQAYFRAVAEALDRLAAEQAEPIRRAADAVTTAVKGGNALYAFGASHSFIIAEELVYRTGGLMLVNPIYPHGMNLFVRPMTLTSRLERVEGLGTELLRSVPAKRGDVLIVASTSGRNAVAIDMALAARDMGMTVIGVTSLAYTSGVASRHSSGKKLADLCSIVLDNGAPLGDAAVHVPGFRQAVGPLSTVLGCTVVNALVSEVVAQLVADGFEPPVYMSTNLDGGDEYNARLLEHYRDRIHYM
jgi:uncharacterized phosphosugar-binding protein